MHSISHVQHALEELQSKTTTVVAGTTADTNIAVAGIKTTDTIGSAIMFTAGVPSDITGTVSITSAGNIQSTSDTSGNQIVVEYYVN